MEELNYNMSKNDLDFQGKISRDYAKKQILKGSIGYFLFYAPWMILTFGLIFVFEASIQLEWFLLMILYSVLIPYVFYLILTVWYEFKYVKMFSFEVLENLLFVMAFSIGLKLRSLIAGYKTLTSQMEFSIECTRLLLLRLKRLELAQPQLVVNQVI